MYVYEKKYYFLRVQYYLHACHGCLEWIVMAKENYCNLKYDVVKFWN